MSKIIQVINSMIENSEEISNVVVKGNEYFFSYKGHVWSIYEYTSEDMEEHGYTLVFYPRTKTVSELESLDYPRAVHPHLIYSSGDFKTKEALESFSNLYTTIKERIYGVDEVFNEIIESSKDSKKKEGLFDF